MKKQTELNGCSRLPGVAMALLLLVSGLSYAQSLDDVLMQDGVLALRAGVGGEVVSVSVEQGEQVTKGQLLLKLGDRVQGSTLKAAQASLTHLNFKLQLAEEDYERQQELYDEGSLSTVELQLIELGVLHDKSVAASARAAVDVAEQNLSYTQIIAPADGKVIALPMVGQRVNVEAGLPVLIKLRLK